MKWGQMIGTYQKQVKGENVSGVILGVQWRLAKKVTFEQRPHGRECTWCEVYLAEGTTGKKVLRKCLCQKIKGQKEPVCWGEWTREWEMRGGGSEFHRIMWPHSCLNIKTQGLPHPHSVRLALYDLVAIVSCPLTPPQYHLLTEFSLCIIRVTLE